MIEAIAGIIALLGGGFIFVLSRLRKAKSDNETLKDHIEVEEKKDEVVDRIREAADELPADGYAVDRLLRARRAGEKSGDRRKNRK